MEIKKHVIFKDQFESKIKKGIDTLSNAVKTTMGPKGKLVLIQKEEGQCRRKAKEKRRRPTIGASGEEKASRREEDSGCTASS